MGLVVGIRWMNNMTQTPRIMPGERNFSMPAGVVPRGGELVVPKEQRDGAARRPNPIRPTPESLTLGRQHFQTACPACHGPGRQGGAAASVAPTVSPRPG